MSAEMINNPLSKVYSPEEIEGKHYSDWLQKGFFHANTDSAATPYCIVIPPPNVTGALHMGHALNNTLQDILIRWKRMEGRNTLWMPGMDHAGIATQNVVEKQLAAEGVDRHALGREAFVNRVWQWKEESGGIILKQLKRLGASCDWDRERFTLDEGLSEAVKEVFVRLYKEGLIYKGDRMINWCPRCHTALSDLEVEHKEQPGFLFHIKYFVDEEESSTGKRFIPIATTRPETLLGDTAIAVHPEDERYKSFIGKNVILPIINRKIPVIADLYVDKAFGTGALKITPAHDPNDFEVGQRHNLDTVKVIDESGKMCGDIGEYNGLDRYECRKKIVSHLADKELLIKEESHSHAVGKCYRCQTVVEPALSSQWFVKIKPLAEPAIAAVREKRIRIIPEIWENTYFSWMENIKDWCISRQIWWGHRIPAWLCAKCGEYTVQKEVPDQCEKCGDKSITQETDVLDTWFSSALWPFSTLGWPEKTKELETYYPTSVLVTGFDILFFWVARMIMMGLKFMGDVPFHDVYIHALVRDAEGQKMSKSKGNIINPLVIMDKYGADSFRFTLAAMAAQGRDIKLSEERIEGYRNFVNKIWNAFRFASITFENYNPGEVTESLVSKKLFIEDRWIISRLQETIKETVKGLESYRFNDSAKALYRFFWHEFCDWYIEIIKPRIFSDGDPRETARATLIYVLENSFRLLHPFMPFITEELWQRLPHTGESIAIMPYPEYDTDMVDNEAEAEMGLVMNLCRAVRSLRSDMNIKPGLLINAQFRVTEPAQIEIINRERAIIEKLSSLKKLIINEENLQLEKAVSAVTDNIEVSILLDGVIDFESERARISKEISKIELEITGIGKKLENQSFVAKAPADVVDKNRKQLEELSASREKLVKNLERIK